MLRNEGLNNERNFAPRSKRIALNSIVLFIRMLVLTLVNLFAVRLVLKGMGIVDYGIYNAIAALVTASSCVSSTLAMSTQRFYSFAIGKGDHEQLRGIFSSSLKLSVVLAGGIIVLFGIFGPWFIQTQMTIPANRLDASILLFVFALGAFIFSLFQIPFLGAIFAHEQMGIYALVSTMDCLLKLLLAYMLQFTRCDKLLLYGIGIMLVAMIVFLAYFLYAKKHYPECKYQRSKNQRLIGKLASFSGWTFYGTMTSMATIQGSALILNVFFGPLANAAFSISNQLYNALNSLNNSTTVAFRPAMIKAYSGHEYNFLNKLFSSSNKLIFYLLFLIVAPFMIEAHDVLVIWLGEENVTEEMTLFCKLYMIYTLLLSLHNPITIIVQATGSVKTYELWVESIFLISLPLAILMFKLGYPPHWMIVSLIICCLLAHVARLIILPRKYPQFNLRKYVTEFVVVAIAIAILSIAGALVTSWICLSSIWLRLITVCLVTTTVILSCIFTFGLNREEKSKVKSLFTNLRRRF